MADWPKQDREIGLSRERLPAGDGKPDRFVTAVDIGLALQVIEAVAEGETLKKICAVGTGMPAKQTFLKWVARCPNIAKAYSAAVAISALSMEEEGIEAAREALISPGTAQKIGALNQLLNQLRWSAARRNPQQYGDKNQTAIVVPVHISTTLNLGDGSATSASRQEEIPDIYTIEVEPLPEEEEDRPLLTGPGQGTHGKVLLSPRLPMDADIRALQDEGKLKRPDQGNGARQRRKETKHDG